MRGRILGKGLINMKGIILAGGNGTRLYPLTCSLSKQLLPIYNKPMIYYSLSTLMLAGIREILVITNPPSLKLFKELLGDGSRIGISLEYRVQHEPRGIPEALIIGESFIGKEHVALMLGDNLFYSHKLNEVLASNLINKTGACIFAYRVPNPSQFGIINFDNKGQAISIIEKPINPISDYAVTGLYFYDNDVIEIAKNLKISDRGELEITDINHFYLSKGKLEVQLLDEDVIWFDAGTPESLFLASEFVKSTEHDLGVSVGCIEELAYRLGYISISELSNISEKMAHNIPYRKYISRFICT